MPETAMPVHTSLPAPLTHTHTHCRRGLRVRRAQLTGLAFLLAVWIPAALGGEWLTDLKEARAKAARADKDLLLLFTGSDWCSGCIKLVEEVFTQDVFKAGVTDSFVLVELDFPQNASTISIAARK